MLQAGTMGGRISVLVALGLLLSGCASMSKNECLAVDWRMVGYEDGVAGRGGDQIAQHRKACARHGVVPEFDAYQSGRLMGLQEFCRPASGFRVGARGAGYGGVCPAELEPDFVDAYVAGLHLFSLQSRVNEAARQVSAWRREVDDIEHRLAQHAVVIVSNDATAEQRAEALVETRQLSERSSRLKSDIRRLERDQAIFERELEEYRATLPWLPVG